MHNWLGFDEPFQPHESYLCGEVSASCGCRRGLYSLQMLNSLVVFVVFVVISLYLVSTSKTCKWLSIYPWRLGDELLFFPLNSLVVSISIFSLAVFIIQH